MIIKGLYKFLIQLKQKKMNISFSAIPMYFNMSQKMVPTVNSGPNQNTKNLLKLLSLALDASLSAYSKNYFENQEEKPMETLASSFVEVEESENVIQIEPPRAQQKRIQVPKNLKINEQIKEKSHSKVQTEEIEKNTQRNQQLQSSFISSEQNKSLTQKIIEENCDYEEWSALIQCPPLGISSQQIQKKRLSLLQRQVTDWKIDAKTGKRKKFSEMRNREMRMLFN